MHLYIYNLTYICTHTHIYIYIYIYIYNLLSIFVALTAVI